MNKYTGLTVKKNIKEFITSVAMTILIPTLILLVIILLQSNISEIASNIYSGIQSFFNNKRFFGSMFNIVLVFNFIYSIAFAYETSNSNFICSVSRKSYWNNLIISFLLINIILTIFLGSLYINIYGVSILQIFNIFLRINLSSVLGMSAIFFILRFSPRTLVKIFIGIGLIFTIYIITTHNTPLIDRLFGHLFLSCSVNTFNSTDTVYYILDLIIFTFLSRFLIMKNDFKIYS